MSDLGAGPPVFSVGRHRLGPQVVGSRIVVRRLVRQGNDEPGVTDTLGICESWGRDACTLRTADGELHTVRIADIITGKPVPPRASARARVPARDTELRGLVLWPSLVAEPLGDWVLRKEIAPEGRRRKRANSALAYGDPGCSTEEMHHRLASFYGEIPVMLQCAIEDTEHWAGLGWSLIPGDVHLQVASLPTALRSIPRTQLEPDLIIDGQRAEARIVDGEQVIASGRVGVDQDWAGVHSVSVEPAFRRRGLASSIMATLLDWAGSTGATTAWLHVESDNDAALSLYDRLRFRTHHTSRYFVRPPTAAD